LRLPKIWIDGEILYTGYSPKLFAEGIIYYNNIQVFPHYYLGKTSASMQLLRALYQSLLVADLHNGIPITVLSSITCTS